MPNCVIIGCNSSKTDKISLFLFPTDHQRCQKWIDLLSLALPSHLNSDNVSKLYVCSRHFPPNMYSMDCHGRRRLVFNAFPDKIIASPPEPSSFDVPSSSSAKSASTQCYLLKDNKSELLKVKKELHALRRAYTNLKKNPSPSFIIKHLNKIKDLMPNESYSLFLSAIANSKKSVRSRRHSQAVKLIASKIHSRNRQAFKVYRSHFALPSIRTLNLHLATHQGISPTTEDILQQTATTLDPGVSQ